MTCLLFCEHLDALLAERIFSLDFCAFVIIKKIYYLSIFFFKLFIRTYFFMIWLQVFLKNSYKWFQ